MSRVSRCRMSRVRCHSCVTWERNNYHKGRARLAYPLSPEWNWKLVFIEFRIRVRIEKNKNKTEKKKNNCYSVVLCCQPVEDSVSLHQMSHSGFVLLLLKLLQSLVDALTEEPEWEVSKVREGGREGHLPGGTSSAWGLHWDWDWLSLGDDADHILRRKTWLRSS